jgi:hypothetical protein
MLTVDRGRARARSHCFRLATPQLGAELPAGLELLGELRFPSASPRDPRDARICLRTSMTRC